MSLLFPKTCCFLLLSNIKCVALRGYRIVISRGYSGLAMGKSHWARAFCKVEGTVRRTTMWRNWKPFEEMLRDHRCGTAGV